MATNGSKITLSFEITVGGEPQGKQEFTQGSVRIGRGSDATLQIDDSALAELHAAVNVDADGGVVLLDLGSEGGTLLNGARIENAPVKDGDEIRMGNTVFRLGVKTATSLSKKVPIAKPTHAPTDKTPSGDPANRFGSDEEQPWHAHGGPKVHGAFLGRKSGLDSLILRTDLPGTDQVIDKGKPRELELVEVWGETILDVKHLGKNQHKVVLGPELHVKDREVHLYVHPDLLPAPHFTLLEAAATVTVYFAESFSGFVEEGPERRRTSLKDLVKSGKATKSGSTYAFKIEAGTRVAIEIGAQKFYIQEVHQPRWTAIPLTQRLDYTFLGVFALLFFLSLILGIIIHSTPYDPERTTEEVPDRLAELLLEEEKKPEIQKKEPSGNPDAGEGAKAKGEEGKVGKKEAKVKTAKGTKVAMNKKQLDKEIAESAGLLADMNQDSNMAALMGASGIGAGASNALGGLIGTNYGVQIGSGGLGGRGSGLGGGGTGEGLGGLGTKGRGTGGSGYGRGGGYIGKKGDGEPSMGTGDPIILGALDKSVIDRVIKSHLNEIRYCYNKELNKNPKLYGKIVIKFVIDKNGKVSSAQTKTSTMKNAIVEQCIESRFMRFQFPQPKGGGIVIVSYPFIFKAAG